MNQNYELMTVLKVGKCRSMPDGIDEESATIGDAKHIIKWLLKNDDSVKGKYSFRLMPRKKVRGN